MPHSKTVTDWQWSEIFSEGGPFLVTAANAFARWPGAAGWQEALGEVEAPGAIVRPASAPGDALCFFDPEDPGPILVGWTAARLALLRFFDGGGAPRRRAALGADGEAAIAAALDAEEPEVETLGEIELTDGLVVVSWAAIGGPDTALDRVALEALAETDPRDTVRVADSGPAVTAVRLAAGRYSVTAVLDGEGLGDGGTWLQLTSSV